MVFLQKKLQNINTVHWSISDTDEKQTHAKKECNIVIVEQYVEIDDDTVAWMWHGCMTVINQA